SSSNIGGLRRTQESSTRSPSRRSHRFLYGRCALSSRIVIDSSPLSLACESARRKPEAAEIAALILAHRRAGGTRFVAEIADYEGRRELLRAGKTGSLRRLDALLPRLT